jgi:AsmA protein
MKKLLIAGAVVIGVPLVLVLAIVLFLDANQFKPQLEAAMGDALGRKVSIGHIRTALLSGGIALEDLSIADDPAFSSTPFVTAKSVSVGVDLMPLIVSRSLHVESFRLEEPQVMLIGSPSGQWNFSGLGGATPSTAPAASASAISMADAVVQKIAIANGRVTISQTAHGGKNSAAGTPRTYESVNVEVSNLSLSSQFPFHLTAKTPGGGAVTHDGEAGPFNATDAAETPFTATVDVADLDIASTGFVDPASGLAGRMQFAGSMSSDGQRLTSKGKVTTTGARLVPAGTPARVPIDLEYESTFSRKTRTGVVKVGDVHVGKAVAHLVGDYNASGETVAVRLKLTGNRMPASELEATLPALGVALPAGTSLKQGSLDINLTISGPLDRLVIAGPINLANVTLTGFDLAGKLSALPSLGGLPKSGDTAIETLAATVRVAPDGIQTSGLNVVAPSIGTLTGAGTSAPRGDLDFKMMANAIPFLVQGTTTNPTFRPDVGRTVASLVRNPESAKAAASKIGGFFSRKAQ